MKIKFLLTPGEIDMLQRNQSIFVPIQRTAPILLEVELNTKNNFIEFVSSYGDQGFDLKLNKERTNW